LNVLVRWCLAHRSVVLLATLLVVVAGAIGATQLRQQYFPEADFPFLIASSSAPGLSAQQVDEQITQPLERAVRALDAVEGVQTIATAGNAQIFVELAYGTDADAAREDIAAAMSAVALPPDAEPVEVSGGFTDQAVFNASLASAGDPTRLNEIAEEVAREMEAIEGVARVEVAGGAEQRYELTLKGAALDAGLTPGAMATQVRSAISAQPVGAVGAGGANTPLIVEGGDVGTIGELRRLEIGEGRQVSDVADVALVEGSGDSFALTNGNPSVSLSIFKTDRADEVTISEEADAALGAARSELGGDNVTTIFETGSEITASVRGLLLEGILGAFFAVIVIFAFLRSARSTLVAAASIPTSIVFGLLAASLLGLSLNIITLAGLTIAIGRVIDDAIVVLENIYKHLERGEPRFQAAVEGTSEVSTAIASSTIATAAVFLPIGLIGGFISEIFFSFSIIVVVALLASLLVAVTVIPVLGSLVLRPPKRVGEPGDSRLSRMVTPATRFGLNHRLITILGALVLFGGAIGGVAAGLVPVQFLPDSGTNQVAGTVRVPAGTSTERLQRLLGPLEQELAAAKGAVDYQVAAGDAAASGDDPVAVTNGATFFLSLEDDAPVASIVESLRDFGTEQYPEDFEVRQVEQGPPGGAFEATVYGEREEDVLAAARRIDALARADEALVEVSTNVLQEQQQYVVELDSEGEQLVGPGEVQAALASLVRPADAGSIGDDDVPITVRVPERLLSSPAALERLPLAAVTAASAAATRSAASAAAPAAAPGGQAPSAGPLGAPAPSTGAPTAPGSLDGTPAPTADTPSAALPETVRLGDVAEVVRRQTRARVFRVDGQLAGITTGRLIGEDTNARIQELRAAISDLDLQGVEVSYEGEASFIQDMFRDLGLAMLVAIALVYVVLVLFFGSITQPITILAPILFSTIGSLLALIITGRALGLPAMIGQLLLIGIVVANSILIVDTALRLRRQGVRRNAALEEAARLRVRPVLMTAVATIAALMPLAIGISGEGGIISQSLGTVVIGGLATATLLTLVIVPAVFTLFDRGRSDPPPVAADAGGDVVAARVAEAGAR